MGNYATTSSISLIVPNFLDGNTTTSDAEGTAIFAKAITRAEDDINSILGARFSTPFTAGSIPPAVITWTEDWATYLALRATAVQDGQLAQVYLDDYKETRALVVSTANGGAALIMSDGSDAPVKAVSRFRSTSKEWFPIFQRDSSRITRRDSDEKSDTRTGRGIIGGSTTC